MKSCVSSSPFEPKSGIGLHLLYVIPAFPWRGLVFEQNELMGLWEEGVSLMIFSCRRVDAAKELNDFAKPLLPLTLYLDLRAVMVELLFGLFQCPLRVARIMLLTLRGCLNPLQAPKVVAAFLCAMQLHRAVAKRCTWIHADFGGNTTTVAMFLGILTGLPFSYKVHAYDIYAHNLLVLDPLRRVKAKKSHSILAEHEDGKKTYGSVSGAPPEKIFVHYSCVRTDVFHPVSNTRKDVHFLALGRLVKKKGFDVLIRAVGLLKTEGISVRVGIHGCGPEKETLESLIDELGLREFVAINGAYDNDHLISMFSRAGALVMPSIVDRCGDRDGVPTVIYEAMACGVPVISSTVGGISEVIRDQENGLLFDPGNIEQLAGAMKFLLSDLSRSRQLGEQGRRDVVAKYDYRDAARKMVSHFVVQNVRSTRITTTSTGK
jgi:colanic acid/amylovoran biosynthesis glycosyltransferase